MKVKELIKKLQRLDGEKEIGFLEEDCIYDIKDVCKTDDWFGEDNYWRTKYFIK